MTRLFAYVGRQPRATCQVRRPVSHPPIRMGTKTIDPTGKPNVMTKVSYSGSQEIGEPPSSSPHRGLRSFHLSGRLVAWAWVLSLAVHGLIFVVLVKVVFPFGGSTEEPAPVTRAELVGPIDAASLAPSASPRLRSQVEVAEPQRLRPQRQDFSDLSEMTAIKRPELSIIGIGAGGGHDASNRFTMDLGAGADFFGLGGSVRGARKIVYVVDRSGSMTDTFVYVQAELRRSVGALRRSQKFHVIFFNADLPLENSPKRLVSAIGAQKENFFRFLNNVVPQGATKPGSALRRALALKPDILYLLSDGIVEARSRLAAELDQWNHDRLTRIFTIAYLDREGAALLEQIAREHNGEFRFVTEHDLP